MSKKTRQLIFVWNYLEWGGAQVYFLGIMKLAKRDWDVKVLLPAGSDENLLGFIRGIGIECEFLDRACDLGAASTLGRKVQRKFRNLLSEIEIFRKLLRFKTKDCVFHIEAAPWQSTGLLTALSLRGATTFVTFHNGLPDVSAWRKLLWKTKLAWASRLPRFHVFTSNQDAKDRFRRWMPERFWSSIRVTYTTVNSSEIEAATMTANKLEVRRTLGIPPEKFVILCLGQFIDRKGRWIFLEAAKSLCSRFDDLAFVWVTASAIGEADQERVASYNLGTNFRLINSRGLGVERSDILATYLAADIYALPSFVEGLPVALLEAMAMGIASISTKVYAIPEAIVDGETGLLIEPGSPEALADAILRLRFDATLRASLAAAGRAHVLRQFDEIAASRKAIDAYSEAIADA